MIDRHDQAEDIAPGVRRLVAPNPSPMTERGTNTWLVGGAALAVIDPGPDDAAHRARLLDAVGVGRVEAVLVTHTHLDHSAGAWAFAQAVGAPVLAFGGHETGRSETMRRLLAADGAAALPGGGEGADRGFQPERTLGDGETVESMRGDWRLTALHTPGHLGNHLSFALEGRGMAEGVVFTGDHVMSWSTSLVSPPDGDMSAYMSSLGRLRARGADRLHLPGHGAPIAEPAARVEALIRHRKTREGQIVTALAEAPGDAATLAARIYTDLQPVLLPAAARNVLAHLLDLAERGLVESEGGAASAAARYRVKGG